MAWSALFDDILPSGATPGHSLLGNTTNKTNAGHRLFVVTSKRGNKAINELLDSLIGASTGGTASATTTFIDHPSTPTAVGALGGARTVSTFTDINRVTTAADVTNLKEMLVSRKAAPSTYAEDASGNGGGGKLTSKYSPS